MRKEMIIRVQTSPEKGHSKAIKVAAAITGVESVTVAGEDKNLLLVIGDEVDSNHLVKKLQKKVGRAEVVELRTMDVEDWNRNGITGYNTYRYHPSPSPYTQMAAPDYYPLTNYSQSHMGGRGYYAPVVQSQHEYPYPASNGVYAEVHQYEYGSDPNNCSIM